MKVAFGTVVYKAAKQYLDVFLKSLDEQTYKEFDLLIINDGIDLVEINEIIRNYNISCNIHNLEGIFEPFQLRIELIKLAKEKEYELLILGDCDDFFSKERVFMYVNEYSDYYTFFYNEILGFSGEKIMPEMPSMVADINDIGEYNFLGLTNTAINLCKLSSSFIESLYEGKTNIFDWYLFSRFIIDNKVGKKINNAYSFYRIYDENVAGKPEINKNAIFKERKVKLEHYRILCEYDIYFFNLYHAYLEKKKKKIKVDEPYHFWWGIEKVVK